MAPVARSDRAELPGSPECEGDVRIGFQLAKRLSLLSRLEVLQNAISVVDLNAPSRVSFP